jgi:hypothetical protein
MCRNPSAAPLGGGFANPSFMGQSGISAHHPWGIAGSAETPCGFVRDWRGDSLQHVAKNRGGPACPLVGILWRPAAPPPMAQLDEETALLPLVLDAQTSEQAAQILDALAILAAAEDQQLLLLALDDLGDGCEPIEPAPSRMEDT